MFVVIRVTVVDEHLRGYLSRFVVEYGTGMYIGNVSARVADSLWQKATDAAGKGEVVMVRNSPNREQGFAVQVHQMRGKDVIDLDGLEFLRSIPENAYSILTPSSD